VLYGFDLISAEKLTYITSTVGGSIAIAELSDKIRTMRRLRGERVFPIVCLSSTHMRTKFGGRERPHFKILRWINTGADGMVLPTPQSPPLLTGQTVQEPSLKEEMGDEVKF
jgi:hypothetical protein